MKKEFPQRNLCRSAVIALALTLLLGPATLRLEGQMELSSDWRPSNAVEGVRYIGSSLCVRCHAEVGERKPSPMAHALVKAAEAETLRAFPRLDFQLGPYRYRVERGSEQVTYSVSDGSRTLRKEVTWAFGGGEAGQTFVFEHNGRFVESQVSFFQAIEGLDLTVGLAPAPPATLEEALGRAMDEKAARNCFGCHSTGAVLGDELRLDSLFPGITCEGCHGPGGNHVAALISGEPDLKILNPDSGDAEALFNFCGSCHRTWEDVALSGIRGVANVRFQPYRLTNSACFQGVNDARLSCLACHDPHQPRERGSAFYDAKCLDCHSSQEEQSSDVAPRSFPECPQESENCVSCHMPRYEIPGSHFLFTDHHIRVVRENDAYPN